MSSSLWTGRMPANGTRAGSYQSLDDLSDLSGDDMVTLTSTKFHQMTLDQKKDVMESFLQMRSGKDFFIRSQNLHIEELMRRNKELEGQLCSTRSETGDLRDRLEKETECAAGAQGQMTNLQGTINLMRENMQQNINEKFKLMECQNLLIAEFATRSRAMETEFQRLTEEINSLKTQNESLEGKAKEKESLSSVLTERVGYLETEIESLEMSMKRYREEHARTVIAKNKFFEEAETAKARVKEIEEKVQGKMAPGFFKYHKFTVKEKEAEIATLRSQLEVTQSQNKELVEMFDRVMLESQVVFNSDLTQSSLRLQFSLKESSSSESQPGNEPGLSGNDLKRLPLSGYPGNAHLTQSMACPNVSHQPGAAGVPGDRLLSQSVEVGSLPATLSLTSSPPRRTYGIIPQPPKPAARKNSPAKGKGNTKPEKQVDFSKSHPGPKKK